MARVERTQSIISQDGKALVPQIGPSSVPRQSPPVQGPIEGPAPLPANVFGPLLPGQTRTPSVDPNSSSNLNRLSQGPFAEDTQDTPEVRQQTNQNVFGTPNVPRASTATGTVVAPGSSASDQDLQDILEVTQATIPEGGSNVVPEPGAELFSDSLSAVQEEENVIDQLNSLSNPSLETERLREVENEMIQLVEQRVAELDSRLESDLASINSQFDQAGEDLAISQKNETGSTAVGLQRIGGFLGPSASSIGAMNNLARTHRNEVTALEGMRASALQSARNAAADQRFELASLRIQEAREIEQEVYSRRQDFFKNILDLSQENRDQEQFQAEEFESKLEAFGKVAASGGKLDPQVAAQIDEFYGVEGFSTSYAEVLKNAQVAENEANAIERQTDLINLLEKIPAGKTISFPDGSQYTGIGSAGDVVTSIQKNINTGEATLVTVDKRTGEITTRGIGNFGAAATAGSGGGTSSGVAPEVNQSNTAQYAPEDVKSIASERAAKLQTGGEREGAFGSLGVFESGQDIIDLYDQGANSGFLGGISREGININLPFDNTISVPGSRVFGGTSEVQDEFAAATTIFTAQFIKAISGAQVSDKERIFLEKALPSEGKTKQSNIAGIKQISNFLSDRYSPSLDLDLSTLAPTEINEEDIASIDALLNE